MVGFIFVRHFLVYSIFARVLNWSLPATYYLLTSPLTTLRADKGGRYLQYLAGPVSYQMCSTNVTFSTAWPGHVLPDGLRCSQVVFGFFNGTPSTWNISELLHLLQTWCFQTDWKWPLEEACQEDILFGGWPKMEKNGQFHKLYARDLVSQMGVLLQYHLYLFENMPDIGNMSKSSYFVIFMSMICDNHLYAHAHASQF